MSPVSPHPGATAIELSGANSYTGSTTITPGTFQLGAANATAGSSSVILSGGTFNPGGFSQAMPSTTLGLAASSTIDFGAGASEVDFANSSAVAWTAGKVLNLANWDATKNQLRFGTDATGLTAGQLAEIGFNGSGLGTAQLDANGYLVVPPATVLLGQPARLSSSVFQFQLSGLAGQNCTVQFSTNLASTNWSILLSTNLSANSVLIQDTQAADPQRFYRVSNP